MLKRHPAGALASREERELRHPFNNDALRALRDTLGNKNELGNLPNGSSVQLPRLLVPHLLSERAEEQSHLIRGEQGPGMPIEQLLASFAFEIGRHQLLKKVIAPYEGR